MPTQGSPAAGRMKNKKSKTARDAAQEFRDAFNIILAYKQADPEADQIPTSVSVKEMMDYLGAAENTVYYRLRNMKDEFELNKGQISRLVEKA